MKSRHFPHGDSKGKVRGHVDKEHANECERGNSPLWTQNDERGMIGEDLDGGEEEE